MPTPTKSLPQSSPDPLRLLVIAGGTGGHITPGLALALELKAMGAAVTLLSLEKNRSYADFAAAPLDLAYYNAPPLGLRPPAVLLLPFGFLRALIQARRILAQGRFDAVIGMGGYSMAPAVFAARLSGIPIFLCEQNAAPGRATRWFASFASCIYLHLPLKQGIEIPGERLLLAGNPLRPALRASAQASRPPRKNDDAIEVLVLGGSQGARQINQMCLQAMPMLSDLPIHWTIQCGQGQLAAMQAALSKDMASRVELLGYVTGIEDFYRRADIVVCRGGAGVLAEVLLFGLPSVIIPYPYAADQHQRANALALVDAGAARLIDRRDESPDELVAALRDLVLHAELRQQLSAAAGALARPEAATTIAADILARVRTR